METEVSPSLATRLPVLTVTSGIGTPLASPDTMDHSPSSRAISSFAASCAPARATTARTAITGPGTRIATPLPECVRWQNDPARRPGPAGEDYTLSPRPV